MITMSYASVALKLVNEMKTSTDVEKTLLSHKTDLDRDITLYTLFLHLGYIPETGQFRQPPEKSDVVSMIKKFYYFEFGE
jgi:hypothetical protein